MKGEPLVLVDGGQVYRTFCYVDDAVESLLQALKPLHRVVVSNTKPCCHACRHPGVYCAFALLHSCATVRASSEFDASDDVLHANVCPCLVVAHAWQRREPVKRYKSGYNVERVSLGSAVNGS